ncbi:MAG: glycosyltransferase family 39 protein [Chloroherpetonaceae bacterium]|nr:glycosyltransferase family 39 protein [Chloroherpetonaceae bacterium]
MGRAESFPALVIARPSTTLPMSMHPDAPESTPARWRYGTIVLLAIALFTCCWRLGDVPLFDLDEALYVACARQMLLRGDMVTPRLNSYPPGRPDEDTAPFFEKPILVYWMAAGAMRLFGQSEGAARVPAAGATLITAGLIFYAGVRWFGKRAGWLAALTFVTAPLTVINARQMTTDSLLVLWTALALIAWCFVEARGPQTRWGVLLFWIACALAVLTKGAIGLLLPVLVILVASLAIQGHGRLRSGNITLRFCWRPLRQALAAMRMLRSASGLLCFLVIVAPWHLAVWRAGERDAQGRTFVQEYLIRQHVGRFQGGDRVHNAPLPAYLIYFLVGFFPWSCFAPVALLGRTRHGNPDTSAQRASSPDSHGESIARFLKIWFWVVLGFFSLSAAKLPSYIAPAYPAAALLTGRWMDQALSDLTVQRTLARGMGAAALIAGLLGVAVLVAPRFISPTSPVPGEVLRLSQVLVLVLGVGCCMAWWCVRRVHGPRAAQTGVVVLTLTLLLCYGVAVTAGYDVARRTVLEPYQQLAAAANPDAARGVPVIYYHIVPRRPSMLFYARYSAYERKERPLRPLLDPLIARYQSALIITSRHTLKALLEPELSGSPDLRYQVERTTGETHSGWVLVRVLPASVSRIPRGDA